MNMQQVMKQAQKMQRQLAEAQDALSDVEVSGTAGGGMVTVKGTADGQISAIERSGCGQRDALQCPGGHQPAPWRHHGWHGHAWHAGNVLGHGRLRSATERWSRASASA